MPKSDCLISENNGNTVKESIVKGEHAFPDANPYLIEIIVFYNRVVYMKSG